MYKYDLRKLQDALIKLTDLLHSGKGRVTSIFILHYDEKMYKVWLETLYITGRRSRSYWKYTIYIFK